tara:strand:- start:1366 stop:1716 length:351 start_codon:yes stop_codon:yes gene_type:complete
MGAKLLFIDGSTFTLPTGHTIKRGMYIDIYVEHINRYSGAIIEGWSKTGRTLTIRRVIPTLRGSHTAVDSNGNAVRVAFRYNRNNIAITLRLNADTGEYESNECHGISTDLEPLDK